jgi:tetratricopeptide (TPR) repeat protein
MQKASWKKGEAVALSSCAMVYYAMGKPDKGISFAKQALSIFSEIGEFKGVAATYILLKDGYLLKGDTASGAVLTKKAAGVYAGMGDKRMEAKMMLALAKVEVAGKDFAKVTAAVDAAKAAFLEAGDTNSMSEAADVLIDYMKEEGNTAEAIKLAKAKITSLHDTGDMSTEAYALLKLGGLLLDSGSPEMAGKVAEVALGMFAGMNDMGGMKQGKELMDGAKQAKLVMDIESTLGAASEYMHIPSTLIVDPGLNKRIQERYSQAVSSV